MMSTFKKYTIAFAVGLGAFTAVAVARDINRAVFNADGSVQAPDNYYKWVHVGTATQPDELNPGGGAPFPEFHSVYVEPSAYDTYLAQGKWPDGTRRSGDTYVNYLRRSGDTYVNYLDEHRFRVLFFAPG